jgi:hypothetical protein
MEEQNGINPRKGQGCIHTNSYKDVALIQVFGCQVTITETPLKTAFGVCFFLKENLT